MENDQVRYDQQEMKSRFDRLANRHENGSAPRAVTAFNLFQTPAPLAGRLVALLDLQPGERILEPSAGLGRLLDAVKPYQPSEVVAVEIAQQCAGELFTQDRHGVTIKQRDFLTMTPGDLGSFDAVAMNPPFHMRADIRHIKHAITFLKPGGRLAALCLDTEHRRRELKPLATQWIELNGGEFRSEGTNIKAAMLLIQN